MPKSSEGGGTVKNRSVGVTVISVLSMVGSVLTGLMGLFVGVIAFIGPSPRNLPASPAYFRSMMLVASLVYLLPAVWGGSAAVGLWRLKNWARISVAVFSVLLIVSAGFGIATTLVIPFPTPQGSGAGAGITNAIRAGMVGFWLTFLSIGVWWLIFFFLPKVRSQFEPTPLSEMPLTGGASAIEQTQNRAARPISITIIAWLLLAGGLLIPLSLLLHAPAIFFTRLLTGRSAVALFLSFAILQVCIGLGLLRLKPAARVGAIAYLAFGFLNSLIFIAAPGRHERAAAITQSQHAMFPWIPQPQFQFDPTGFELMGAVTGFFFIAIQIYFLITCRGAFEAKPR
jgi:hypothetical protein